MLPGSANPTPLEVVYRPGSLQTEATVGLPDLGVFDLEVEVIAEWDADGDWCITDIRIPGACSTLVGNRAGDTPGLAAEWWPVATLKAGSGPLSVLHRLFMLRVADAAEWAISDCVLDEMGAAA